MYRHTYLEREREGERERKYYQKKVQLQITIIHKKSKCPDDPNSCKKLEKMC